MNLEVIFEHVTGSNTAFSVHFNSLPLFYISLFIFIISSSFSFIPNEFPCILLALFFLPNCPSLDFCAFILKYSWIFSSDVLASLFFLLLNIHCNWFSFTCSVSPTDDFLLMLRLERLVLQTVNGRLVSFIKIITKNIFHYKIIYNPYNYKHHASPNKLFWS